MASHPVIKGEVNRYYVHQPRGFANEYTVYVVNNDGDEQRLAAAFPINLYRITRKRAIFLGLQRPNEARRYGQQWYGGFAYDGSEYRDPSLGYAGEIAAAITGTRFSLEHVEANVR